MASAFNLTAQLNLQGPTNVNAIVNNIRRQLGSISANVNVNVNPNTARNIAGLNRSFATFNATLATTTANANNAARAISVLTASVGRSANPLNNLQRNLQNNANATQQLTQNLNTLQRNTRQVTNSWEEFGRQGALAVRRFAAFATVTGIIYKVGNAISSASKDFVEFNRELVRVAQVTGSSVSQLGSLIKEITSLATGLGVTSESLIQVSSTLAQAGLSARDTQKALKALALSALAPSFDSMNETVEGSIALMRQFGISADELESALGSVNAVAAKFAVEASDIITAIQRTGGVFAAASRGVSEGTQALNEFIAVFTSVRATTRESAETIATGLRTIFTRIQRKGTIEALQEFGVVLTDLQGKFVGPFEAVRRLSEGLSKLDPRDLRFAEIVEELGGFRQIGKVIPLIQQFATAQQALKVAQSGQASLALDAAIAQESVANKITKVREEFIALIRSIGQSQGFQTFVSLALDLTSALIRLADAAKNVLPAIAAVTAIRGTMGLASFARGFAGGIRGGGARGFATGGLVPGQGNTDTYSAMLTPGEFVIRKKAVERIGASNLYALNRNSGGPIPRRYAGAGNVAPINTREVAQQIQVNRKEKSFSGKATSEGLGTITSLSERISTIPDNTKVYGGAFLYPGANADLQGTLDRGVIQAAVKKGSAKLYNALSFAKKDGNIPAVQAISNELKEIEAVSASKGNFLVSTGSLSDLTSQNIEGIILNKTIEAVQQGARVLSSNLGTKIDEQGPSEAARILKQSNIDNVLGNIFEAMISNAGVPYADTERDGANDPFDFPQGLGGLAGQFGQLRSNVLTDAKTRFTGSNITSLMNKVKNYEAKELLTRLENFFLTTDLSEAFSSGAPRGKAKELAGYSPSGLYKETKTDLAKRVAARGLRKASGGSIEDTVPALLTPGEFVINKKAASTIGAARLHQLNRADRISGFNKGGFVQRFYPGGGVRNLVGRTRGVRMYVDPGMPFPGQTNILGTIDDPDVRETAIARQRLEEQEQRLQLQRGYHADLAQRQQARAQRYQNLRARASRYLPFSRRGAAAPVGGLGYPGSMPGAAPAAGGAPANPRAGGGMGGLGALALSMAAAPAIEGLSGLAGGQKTLAGNRISSMGTDALNYGTIGATIGSMIPVVGTAMGGLIGAAVGLTTGFFKATKATEEYAQSQKVNVSQQALETSGKAIGEYAQAGGAGRRQAAIESFMTASAKEADVLGGIKREQGETLKDFAKRTAQSQEEGAKQAEQLLEAEMTQTGKTFDELRKTLDPATFAALTRNIAESDIQYAIARDSYTKDIEKLKAEGKLGEAAQLEAQRDQELQNLSVEIARRAASEVTATIQNERIAQQQAALGIAIERAVLSYEKTFDIIDQTFGRAAFEMENLSNTLKQITTGAAPLTGNALARDIDILKNPTAYSQAERAGVGQRAGNLYGGSIRMAGSLSMAGENIANIANKAAAEGGDVETVGKIITDNIKNTFGADTSIGRNLSDQVKNMIAKKMKEAEDGEPVDIYEFIESALAPVMRISEGANKAQIAAIQNTISVFNQLSEAGSSLVDIQLQMFDRSNKMNQMIEEGYLQQKQALGIKVTSEEKAQLRLLQSGRRAGLGAGVQATTAGLVGRRGELRMQQAGLQQQIAEAEGNLTADPAAVQQLLQFKTQLESVNNQLSRVDGELENLPQLLQENLSDIFSDMQQRVSEISATREANVGLLETLVTSTPQELMQMNQTFELMNRTFNGQIVTIRNSTAAQQAYYQSLMQNGNVLEANNAAQAAFANQNKMAIQMFDELAKVAGITGEEFTKMRAQLLQNFLNSTGLAGTPIAQMAMEKAKETPEEAAQRDPLLIALQQEADLLRNMQIDAINAANNIAIDKQASILNTVVDRLITQIQNTTFRLDTNIATQAGMTGMANPAQGFSKGGSVGGDTVPAMLTPGEFVINKASAKKHGGLLNAINRSSGGIAYLADGGPTWYKPWTWLSAIPSSAERRYRERGGGARKPKLTAMTADVAQPGFTGVPMNQTPAEYLGAIGQDPMALAFEYSMTGASPVPPRPQEPKPKRRDGSSPYGYVGGANRKPETEHPQNVETRRQARVAADYRKKLRENAARQDREAAKKAEEEKRLRIFQQQQQQQQQYMAAMQAKQEQEKQQIEKQKQREQARQMFFGSAWMYRGMTPAQEAYARTMRAGYGYHGEQPMTTKQVMAGRKEMVAQARAQRAQQFSQMKQQRQQNYQVRRNVNAWTNNRPMPFAPQQPQRRQRGGIIYRSNGGSTSSSIRNMTASAMSMVQDRKEAEKTSNTVQSIKADSSVLADKYLPSLSKSSQDFYNRSSKFQGDSKDFYKTSLSNQTTTYGTLKKVGMVASAAGGYAMMAHLGKDQFGDVNWNNFAKGGTVYASRGMLVNYEPKGTDTVPAMLTPGEFVVNANATRNNLGLLQTINSGGYSRGGVVYLQNGGTSSVQPAQQQDNGVLYSIAALQITFDNFISKLTASLPPVITVQGRHDVNVIVNGAGILQNLLSGPIGQLVQNAVQEAFAIKNRQNEGQ